jgi:hypothetical protein
VHPWLVQGRIHRVAPAKPSWAGRKPGIKRWWGAVRQLIEQFPHERRCRRQAGMAGMRIAIRPADPDRDHPSCRIANRNRIAKPVGRAGLQRKTGTAHGAAPPRPTSRGRHIEERAVDRTGRTLADQPADRCRVCGQRQRLQLPAIGKARVKCGEVLQGDPGTAECEWQSRLPAWRQTQRRQRSQGLGKAHRPNRFQHSHCRHVEGSLQGRRRG